MEIELKASHYFVNNGHSKDHGEFDSEDRELFKSIREAWPELSEWGDLAISSAWGSYSQDVYMLSWLDASKTELSRENLLAFIAYIYWHEINGEPQWGTTTEELLDFANEQKITI